MANTFELIASTTLASDGTIDFTSIPSTFTDLVLDVSIRCGAPSLNPQLRIRFNSDTGANYSSRRLEGSGSAASSSSQSGAAYIIAGYTDGSYTGSNIFASGSIYIPNYASSNHKSISADMVTEDNATEAYATMVAGLWSSTSAITSISLFSSSSDFKTNSTAYLYGVKNA